MQPRARYQALDGWRGLCALGVALFHLTVISHLTANQLVQHAYLLVDFFFALSGFIIAHTYLGRVRTGEEAGAFLLRRIGRLWPLHLATLSVLAAWELLKLMVAAHLGETPPFTGAHSPQSLIEAVFLVHAWGASHAPTWNVPSWSISVEWAACILFAGLCLVARGREAIGAAVLALVGMLGVVLVARRMDVTCDYGVLRGMAGFFLGVLVRFAPPLRLPARLAAVAEISAVVAAIAFLRFAPGTPVEFAAPPVFALMVWVFAAEGGVVSRVLTLAPLQSLGRWSYSIYLIHFPVVVGLGVARKLVEHVTGWTLTRAYPTSDGPIEAMFVHSYWAMDGLALAYLALVIGLSALTYRLIEQPGRAAINVLATTPRMSAQPA